MQKIILLLCKWIKWKSIWWFQMTYVYWAFFYTRGQSKHILGLLSKKLNLKNKYNKKNNNNKSYLFHMTPTFPKILKDCHI